jgi:hypothetical protein
MIVALADSRYKPVSRHDELVLVFGLCIPVSSRRHRCRRFRLERVELAAQIFQGSFTIVPDDVSVIVITVIDQGVDGLGFP